MSADLDPRFTELLARYLPVLGDHPLTDGSHLRDLGLDSMRSIDLLFDIEDTFGVTLPDEELTGATFETVGALWRAVCAARAAGEPAA